MAGQKIKQGNIFGRIGTGFGQGLAEQLPKEVSRYRLASGLEQIEKDAPNLNPLQLMTRLAATPGGLENPQFTKEFANVARQQARGKALSDFNGQDVQGQPNQTNQAPPFPINIPSKNEQPNEEQPSPSLTKSDIFARVQEGYIPPTQQEKTLRAGQLYDENPAFFGNDPQQAIDYVDKEVAQDEKVAEAYQTKHKNLDEIQSNVVKRLKAQSDTLGVQVPAELFSKIEDEAIKATKPKKDGGEGLSEQQAMKKYGKKLNDASRSFEKLDEVGNWGITFRPAEETIRALDQIQDTMEKMGETDNMAKLLSSRNKLSPQMSYSLAEPVNKIEDLNKTIKSLPDLFIKRKVPRPFMGPVEVKELNPEVSKEKTLEIAPSLAEFVKNNPKASPLAISYELKKKGYDSSAWLKYLVDNKKELDLRTRQVEQASTPLNTMTPWNDWWLSSFTGIR